MITETISRTGQFLIRFENFNGSGWQRISEEIIVKRIKPDKIEKKVIEQSIDYSEYEFLIEKDNTKFIYHLDDEGPIYIELDSEITEDNKQKLRDWAMIIATETAKI